MEVVEPNRLDLVQPMEITISNPRATKTAKTNQSHSHSSKGPKHNFDRRKYTPRPTKAEVLYEQQRRAELFGIHNRRVAAQEAMRRKPEPEFRIQAPLTANSQNITQPKTTPIEAVKQFKIPKKPKIEETPAASETEAERRERHQRIAALEASLRALKRTPSPQPRPSYQYDENCHKWQREESDWAHKRDDRHQGEHHRDKGRSRRHHDDHYHDHKKYRHSDDEPKGHKDKRH